MATTLTDALIEASLVSGQDEEIGSATEAPGTWAALFRFTDTDRRTGIN